MAEEFTGNDVALCLSAIGLALNWHKLQPKSDFNKDQIAKLHDLNARLSDTFNWAYPEGYHDGSDGQEAILIEAKDQCGLVQGRTERDLVRGIMDAN